MTISKSEISKLPHCVAEYLRYAGVAEREKIHHVFLEQKGKFKTDSNGWIKIRAKQYVEVDQCNFIWKAKAGLVRVVDQYVHGHGLLAVTLLGLLPLGKVSGKETDQGELSRFLAEIIWYPSAVVSNRIDWKSMGEMKASATIKDISGNHASLLFEFNDSFEITQISGQRYKEQSGTFSLEDWLISGLKYDTFHGVKIPSKAEVSWVINSEKLPYYSLEITNIEFNGPSKLNFRI